MEWILHCEEQVNVGILWIGSLLCRGVEREYYVNGSCTVQIDEHGWVLCELVLYYAEDMNAIIM